MFHFRRSRPRRSPTPRRVLVFDPCGRWHTRLWVYIVREHERGRQLSEILGDPFVQEHASVSAITHVLADPAFVRRLGDDCRRPLLPSRSPVRREWSTAHEPETRGAHDAA